MSCYDNLFYRNGRARMMAGSLLLCYALSGLEFAWAQNPPPSPSPVPIAQSSAVKQSPTAKTPAQQSPAAKATAKPATGAAHVAPASQPPVWTPNPDGRPQPQGAPLPRGGVPFAPGTVPSAENASKNPPAARKPLPPPPSPPPTAGIERFPLVADLEKLMFGTTHTGVPLDFRLDRLESHVFQRTFPNLDSNTRVNQLRETLIGTGDPLTSPATQPYIPANPPKSSAAPRTAPPYNQAPQYGGQPPQYTKAPQTAPPMTGGLQYGTGPQYNAPPQFGRPVSPPYGSQPQAAMPPSAQPPIDPSAQQPYIPNSVDGLYQEQQDQQGSQQPPTPQPLPHLRFVDSPEFQKEMSREHLEKYAMEVINEVRANINYPPFKWDPEAHKVGNELLADLAKSYGISHHNSKAENPDMRYTKAGGNDAMLESLTALSATGKPVFNKALVIKLIDSLYQKQDDRDALLSPNATQFSFSIEWSGNQKKLLACAEVVTKHAEVASIPREATVGEKIDVKGIIHEPYKFVRISVAWEGIMPAAPEPADDSNEAMPYFPPLDYEAYARKAEHDWSKRTRVLQTVGMMAAIAGGVFIPPVALAAPLIAAAGSNVRPKAVSEIPIHGGVDVDGQTFSHKVPLDNDDKEGIYYITVWASNSMEANPVAVSRRAIIVRANEKKKKGDQPVETTAGTDPTTSEIKPTGSGEKPVEKPVEQPAEKPVAEQPTEKSIDKLLGMPEEKAPEAKQPEQPLEKAEQAIQQQENVIRQPDSTIPQEAASQAPAKPDDSNAPNDTTQKETPKADDPVQAFDEAVRK
jgi:uncharacterized protein YkwD